ncbi:MAG: FmdB family transcriptional regulator [Chloroflexi bacterium]|nr:FmdB family transcriptional regulator [Chloroflexota bacterium]
MPTYDYQCRACGTVTEVIHPMSEDGPSVCELCGGALRRVIHPAGIIFKGSGFYRTDSRSSSSSSISGGDKGSASGNGDAGGSAPKSDAASGTTAAPDSTASKPAKDSTSSPSSS